VVIGSLNLAQLNIGLGIGFSAVSIPQLQSQDSKLKVGLTEIAWFGNLNQRMH